MILALESLAAYDADVAPLVRVRQLVLGQRARVVERLATHGAGHPSPPGQSRDAAGGGEGGLGGPALAAHRRRGRRQVRGGGLRVLGALVGRVSQTRVGTLRSA